MKASLLALSSVLFVVGCGSVEVNLPKADYGCVESALRNQPLAEDVAQAKTFFQAACESGSAEGCSVLGVMIEEGRGFDRDDALARRLFERACGGGVLRACTNLGRLEREENPRVAATMFRVACDGGESHGCVELARLSRDGVGAPQDKGLAEMLFARACDAGDADACGELVTFEGASASAMESAAVQGCALGDARACAYYAEPAPRSDLATAR